jgi:light-regulated signal transduction histidine kinase (bacteriophytochrome)
MSNAAAALASVDIGPIAGASGVYDLNSNNYGNAWALFGAYFDEIVHRCTKAVVEEFGCVLASVDVTTPSACRVAQSFWRIDY